MAVCFGSLCCWKMYRCPSLRSRVLWSGYSSRVSLFIAALNFSSKNIITTWFCHHQALLWDCYCPGDAWETGFLLEFNPKNTVFVSSDLIVLESVRALFAKSRLAAMCLLEERLLTDHFTIQLPWWSPHKNPEPLIASFRLLVTWIMKALPPSSLSLDCQAGLKSPGGSKFF